MDSQVRHERQVAVSVSWSGTYGSDTALLGTGNSIFVGPAQGGHDCTTHGRFVDTDQVARVAHRSRHNGSGGQVGPAIEKIVAYFRNRCAPTATKRQTECCQQSEMLH